MTDKEFIETLSEEGKILKPMTPAPKIIGNKSDGFNYHYASLADIARAGVEIPPMRVATLVDGEQNPIVVNGQPIEYIEAFVNNKWERGARIVIPKMNKSNEAQEYGSALTYARRYTVLSLLGIACDDDDKIESHSKEDIEANIKAHKEAEAELKAELKSLWDKAGGKEGFEDWLKKNTEKNSLEVMYHELKTALLKKITDKAEGEKK